MVYTESISTLNFAQWASVYWSTCSQFKVAPVPLGPWELQPTASPTVQYRKGPSKTNVPFKILRTGTVCRYFLCICVCQGQYSVGTAGWCTLNWLCSYNEHGQHEFTIRKTVVPLPSLRLGLKLICVHMRPAQCQTIVPTFQWSIIVQVSYGHITIRFELQWRDGRDTVICRILN